jgi:hypothetical protein
MKRLLAVTLTSGLAVAASAGAADPFVGKWRLDPARSTLVDRMAIEAVGPDKYSIRFGDGEPETVVADGTDHPGRFGTTLAVAVGSKDRWTVVRKKDGRPGISAVWTLSPDGKTLSDAFTGHEPDGSTFSMNLVYDRTGPGSGFAGLWESTSMQMNSVYEMEVKAYEEDGLTFEVPAQKRTQDMKFDGKDYAETGPNLPPGMASSGRRVDERTLLKTGKLQGKVLDTTEWKLSPDLRTLTLTSRPPNQGKATVLVFDRQAGSGGR